MGFDGIWWDLMGFDEDIWGFKIFIGILYGILPLTKGICLLELPWFNYWSIGFQCFFTIRDNLLINSAFNHWLWELLGDLSGFKREQWGLRWGYGWQSNMAWPGYLQFFQTNLAGLRGMLNTDDLPTSWNTLGPRDDFPCSNMVMAFEVACACPTHYCTLWVS